MLTSTQYNFNDLLFDVDSKLFACSKSESHCLYHHVCLSRMLPVRSCSGQMSFLWCSSSEVRPNRTFFYYSLTI